MADPYAAREAVFAGEQRADEGPARELVARLGGVAVVELGDLRPLEAAEGATFVAAVVRDEGPLPPVARVDPAFAVLLVVRTPDGCRPANDALAELEGSGLPVYLMKQGLVAGPAGSEGAYAVETELLERVLRAALAGEVEWEVDPDFGYEVPARVPGVTGRDADALCPRLLYGAADRVYEHADAVVAVKRERRRRATAAPGIDERILAAAGWPIEATGDQWKD